MKSLFLIVFTSLCFVSASVGQQKYVWEHYGLSFTLADDFEESVNNGEEFTAVGDGMEFTILPFSDDEIDEDDITAYTMSVAAYLQLGRIDDLSTINFNGFKGAYAEGSSDGVMIFMMGLIDPRSDTNFFIIITFLDGDGNASDEAVRICKSIRRI